MQAPEFWYPRTPAHPGRGLDKLWPWLLSPLALLYALAGWLRQLFVTPRAVSVPVVCVGNLVAGGTGKTPAVIAIAKQIRAEGTAVHVLTRGYGGRLSGPLAVDPACHDSSDVGDEALLLAEAAPTWVARERYAAARAAIHAGAEFLILDDGLQNPHLAKDFSVALVDAKRGLGNGWVIPAGPLREPRRLGLRRADALLLVDAQDGCETETVATTALPAFAVSRQPALAAGQLEGRRVFAFCGIGHPQQFFDMLHGLKAELVGARAFPDHHPFTTAECAQLRADAAACGAQLVTTAKDCVRLPESFRSEVFVVPLEMQFADMTGFMRLLHDKTAHKGGAGNG